MGDILVLYGSHADLERGSAILMDRPAMSNHRNHVWEKSWGRVFLQQSKGASFEPLVLQKRTIIPVGRPIVRGHTLARESDAFARWVIDQTGEDSLGEHAERISEQLSGMYTVMEITDHGVSVLTDHMGFRPVYIARHRKGAVIGLGTHVESLAGACGLDDDIDLVSVGELLTHNFITYPYTTRNSVRELEPCSISVFDRHGAFVSRVLWEPQEPHEFPSEHEMRDRLRSALLEAGDDLTRGCSNAAVLLSGGIDSRAVLAATPKERVQAVLTYVTNENRETKTAGEVARTAGVPQFLVQRTGEYFPELVKRGLSLLGMELRGNCHGLCIADNGLCDRFDVVIGGQLSDTLLKDHFMPFPRRQALCRKTLRNRVRELVKGPIPVRTAGPQHTTGRAALEVELTSEIADRVRSRRSQRLHDVQRVRPTTADEWHRFWPCSRQDDSAHTLGNARIMCADTLFAHQAIVEVSQSFDPRLRVNGFLADEVFIKLCGELSEIMNANTGLPARITKHQARHKQRRKHARAPAEGGLPKDWNDVQTSWVDPVLMQRDSRFWAESRAYLADSPALGVLSKVISRGGPVMIGSYQYDLPSTTNHIAMQLALWLDRVSRRPSQTTTEHTA